MTEAPELTTIWESVESVKFTINEAASEVDGAYIIAKVEGPAFFPDSISRNKVRYPLEAWENALSQESFIEKLNDRLIFGTIGHDPELTDNDVREGKISHIVSKVWIDENSGLGMAEYLVLNTPPGQVLNTLLRAGSKLRVSTRAQGFFENSQRDGSRSVVPDKFILERIDFVCDPGYRQALPKLLESFSDTNPDKETNMSDAALQILESQVTKTEGELTTLREQLGSANVAKTRAETLTEAYSAFGTIAHIQESLSELDQYRSIGTVQELHEAMDEGELALDQLTDTLTDTQAKLEDTTQTAQKAAEYDELGAPSEVRDALDAAQTALAELEQYRQLGSLEEIQAVIARANEMTEALETQELQSMADKYGVSLETVMALCDKCSTVEEADALLLSIKGSPAAPTPAAPGVETPAVVESDNWFNEDGTPNPDGCYDADGVCHDDRKPKVDPEDDDEKAPISESMSSRLLNRSHKFATRIRESADKNPKQVPNSLAARLMTRKR